MRIALLPVSIFAFSLLLSGCNTTGAKPDSIEKSVVSMSGVPTISKVGDHSFSSHGVDFQGEIYLENPSIVYISKFEHPREYLLKLQGKKYLSETITPELIAENGELFRESQLVFKLTIKNNTSAVITPTESIMAAEIDGSTGETTHTSGRNIWEAVILPGRTFTYAYKIPQRMNEFNAKDGDIKISLFRFNTENSQINHSWDFKYTIGSVEKLVYPPLVGMAFHEDLDADNLLSGRTEVARTESELEATLLRERFRLKTD